MTFLKPSPGPPARRDPRWGWVVGAKTLNELAEASTALITVVGGGDTISYGDRTVISTPKAPAALNSTANYVQQFYVVSDEGDYLNCQQYVPPSDGQNPLPLDYGQDNNLPGAATVRVARPYYLQKSPWDSALGFPIDGVLATVNFLDNDRRTLTYPDGWVLTQHLRGKYLAKELIIATKAVTGYEDCFWMDANEAGRHWFPASRYDLSAMLFFGTGSYYGASKQYTDVVVLQYDPATGAVSGSANRAYALNPRALRGAPGAAWQGLVESNSGMVGIPTGGDYTPPGGTTRPLYFIDFANDLFVCQGFAAGHTRPNLRFFGGTGITATVTDDEEHDSVNVRIDCTCCPSGPPSGGCPCPDLSTVCVQFLGMHAVGTHTPPCSDCGVWQNLTLTARGDCTWTASVDGGGGFVAPCGHAYVTLYPPDGIVRTNWQLIVEWDLSESPQVAVYDGPATWDCSTPMSMTLQSIYAGNSAVYCGPFPETITVFAGDCTGSGSGSGGGIAVTVIGSAYTGDDTQSNSLMLSGVTVYGPALLRVSVGIPNIQLPGSTAPSGVTFAGFPMTEVGGAATGDSPVTGNVYVYELHVTGLLSGDVVATLGAGGTTVFGLLVCYATGLSSYALDKYDSRSDPDPASPPTSALGTITGVPEFVVATFLLNRGGTPPSQGIWGGSPPYAQLQSLNMKAGTVYAVLTDGDVLAGALASFTATLTGAAYDHYASVGDSYV